MTWSGAAAVAVTAALATVHHHASIDQQIRHRFGRHQATAVCLAHAEVPRHRGETRVAYDRRRTTVVSTWGDIGVMQVNPRFHPQYSVRVLETAAGNIDAAWEISDHGRDWSAWTGTYGRGMCHGLG